VTTVPGATIGELAQMMTKAHVRRIIIVDGENKPIGIVSATDILAALAQSGAYQPFQPEARPASLEKAGVLG
jgi:CBS domain-containing protein